MPPKKNLTKKSFLFKKNFNIRAINSIVIQCKVNNDPLNCGKKQLNVNDEKRAYIAKFKQF